MHIEVTPLSSPLGKGGVSIAADRRIILPRPGRDAPAEPAAGRRRRSAAWRRTRAGRAAFTFGDIGGCGCGSCSPCPIPTTTRTAAWTQNCFVAPVSGTIALPYQGGGLWQSACFATGAAAACTQYARIAIQCGLSGSWPDSTSHATYTGYFVYTSANPACTGTPVATYYWYQDGPASYYGGIGDLVGPVCSPLNLPFVGTTGRHGTWNLTIT